MTERSDNSSSVPLRAPKPHVAATRNSLSRQASSSFSTLDDSHGQLPQIPAMPRNVHSPAQPVLADLSTWYQQQTSTPESLATAYGAAHGQPNAVYDSIDWMTPPKSSFPVAPMGAFAAPQPQASGGHNSFATVQLQQQLAQLQLQQQQDHVALQQQMLLAQIQAAQELRAKADMQASMQAQHHKSQSQMAHETPHNSMLFGSSPRRGARSGTPLGHSRSPLQLPEDVTKAMSAVNHIRQVEQSQRESSRSPLTSPARANERRSATPSIVIDGSRLPTYGSESPSNLRAIGAGSPQQFDPRYGHGRRSPALRNNASKRASMNELGVGQAPMSRTETTSRPKSLSAASLNSSSSGLVHHPRRQPRGPPMESFFANNFLARRSIRTRREAMSKLVSSARAPSFGSPLPVSSSD